MSIPRPPTAGAVLSSPSEGDNLEFEVEDFRFQDKSYFSKKVCKSKLKFRCYEIKADILFSRLKEWSSLNPSCKISKPKKQHINFYKLLCKVYNSILFLHAQLQTGV